MCFFLFQKAEIGRRLYFGSKGKKILQITQVVQSKKELSTQWTVPLPKALKRETGHPASEICFPLTTCELFSLWQPVSMAGITYLMWNQLSCPIPQVYHWCCFASRFLGESQRLWFLALFRSPYLHVQNVSWHALDTISPWIPWQPKLAKSHVDRSHWIFDLSRD